MAMAAPSDSMVDFVEDQEEERFNRRHQELVRRLRIKRDSGSAPSYMRESPPSASDMLASAPVMSGRKLGSSSPPVITENSLDETCSRHSYQTQLFCKDCRALVCALCLLFGNHKGHDSADVEETR